MSSPIKIEEEDGLRLTYLWDDSDDELDEIEVIGQITAQSGSLVENLAMVQAEKRQTEGGSMSVERGLDGGWPEEEDKTGTESRGQMRDGYAAASAQGNKSPSSAPARPHTRRSSRQDPSEANPSYTPSTPVPNAPAALWPPSPYYVAACYMTYQQMFSGPHLPSYPPHAMYGHPYSYGPPMYGDYRGAYAPMNDPYDPVRSGGRPPPMGYGAMPYGYGYARPPTAGPDGSMYRSPNPGSPPPTRKGDVPPHTRRPSGEHIPRPRNAFIFYRSHLIKSQSIPHSLEPDHRNLSRIAGQMWKKLTEEERAPFNEMARTEKETHKQKYPRYRYTPTQRNTHHTIAADGSRRRVHRRPEADKEEVERCAEMANLISQGITGDKLETAMKENGHFRDSPTAGAKRKRNRHRSPDSEDETPSPPPPPAYRSAAPSVMRGAEPEAKSGPSTANGQGASAAGRNYWEQAPAFDPATSAPQPFYAGHDDPNAFIIPRHETSNTTMEPFQFISTQAAGGVEGANQAIHTVASSRAAANLAKDAISVTTETQHALSDERSSVISPTATSGSQGVLIHEGENSMSYYQRGMSQLHGYDPVSVYPVY